MEHDNVPIREVNALNQIEVQCTKAKTEIYRIKHMVDRHIHQEHREVMAELWQEAYNAFDKLQAFVLSR